MLVPANPPQPVPIYSGFDYVTVDATRRRVYAAHTGARSLLVVDADSGAVLGQARTGPMHGVAVNPLDGHVFTGNGTDDSVGEVDPVALKTIRSVAVPGHVDAIAYDPGNRRIYADEDDGTRLFVIDAAAMKLVATIVIPGHKPEYLAVDPRTHDVYQNIDDRSEIAVIDAQTLKVKRTIATPDIVANHPLQYDPEYGEIVVAGSNHVMSVYTPAGRKVGQLAVGAFDQCDLDTAAHVLACGGSGGITRFALQRDGAPRLLETTTVDPGVHTVAIDPQTHAVFAVWAARDGSGDFVRKFTPAP